jgi:hypothetical protein
MGLKIKITKYALLVIKLNLVFGSLKSGRRQIHTNTKTIINSRTEFDFPTMLKKIDPP